MSGRASSFCVQKLDDSHSRKYTLVACGCRSRGVFTVGAHTKWNLLRTLTTSAVCTTGMNTVLLKDAHNSCSPLLHVPGWGHILCATLCWACNFQLDGERRVCFWVLRHGSGFVILAQDDVCERHLWVNWYLLSIHNSSYYNFFFLINCYYVN